MGNSVSKYVKIDRSKLIALRRKRGLSQEAFCWECQAQSLRISISTIKRVESGKAILYRTANDVARFFNVPLSDIVSPEEHSSVPVNTRLASRKPLQNQPGNVLLGRDFEIHQFREVLNNCIAGGCGRLLCVRGVAGIGKTRLLREFSAICKISSVNFHGVSVSAVQASSEHSSMSLLLHQLIGTPKALAQEDTFISALAQKFNLDDNEQLHVCNLLGIELPNNLRELNNAIGFTRRVSDEYAVLYKILKEIYATNPCVIAFDDVHWADETLLLSLRALSSNIRDIPILLILATRLENDPIDAVWRSSVINTPTMTLDLSPLNTLEANQYSKRYPNVDADYLKQAITLSEGNPLFLDQLLLNYPNMVGCYPNDLNRFMSARLTQLDEIAQRTIKAASVIGFNIDLDVLSYMLEQSAPNLKPLVAQLLIRPSDNGHAAFCHELIRQGVYENIGHTEKRELHAKAAQWYLGKDKHLYAMHLSFADSYKASTAFLEAAEEQSEKHNYGAALAMVDKALLIAKTDSEHYSLLLFRGLVLKQLDLPEKSLKCFTDALSRSENEEQRCELYLEIAAVQHSLQRRDEAERYLALAEVCKSHDHHGRYTYLQHQISESTQSSSMFASSGLFDHQLQLTTCDRVSKVFENMRNVEHGRIAAANTSHSETSRKPNDIIKVGLLHSISGKLRELEEGVIRTTLLAIGEINENGGLLGRMIEPVLVDGQSNEEGFRKGALDLIENHQVHTIFGCSTSSSRRLVKPIIESNDHLLMYPFQYEGIEQSSHIFYVGPAPNQTALSAVEWLFHKHHHNYYLLGSDYVYPVVTNSLIKHQLNTWKLNMLEEAYVPLGCTHFTPIIEKIKLLRPQAVILTLVGLASNREFFKQVQQAGIDTSSTTFLSLVLSENDLIAIPTDTVRGTHTVFGYFQNFDSPINAQFVRRYKQCYGVDKQVGGYMESAYVGVYLWAKAVQQTNSLDRRKIREALKGIAHFGPGGVAYIDEENNHVWRHVQVAKVGDDGEFHTLWRSDKPVKPEPFPKGSTPEQWSRRLNLLRTNRWQGGWERSCPDKDCANCTKHAQSCRSSSNAVAI